MASAASSVQRVEALLKTLGLEDRVKRISDNVWSLKKGSATVQLVAAPQFVVTTARVADHLPEEDKEGFFRLLLESNVELLGAFFTLENDGSVRINQVVPVEWLQEQELAFIIGNVASRADEWDDKLAARVDAAKTPGTLEKG